jgi:hypothetical protein
MKNTMTMSLTSLSLIALLALSGCSSNTTTEDTNTTESHEVSDAFIAAQRAALATNFEETANAGAQSPRDIDSVTGNNIEVTVHADPYQDMNLCDIHFHKSAEHKGGQFTTYAGNGDGHGYGTGYKYTDALSPEELASYSIEDEHNPLHAGDTIEVHYVYTSNANATQTNGLGSCLTGAVGTPILRVEAQVYVLVNNGNGLNFVTQATLTTNGAGHPQASFTEPADVPVEYEGSTTGPSYNEVVSPYQVSWRVHPTVQKLEISTVDAWLGSHGNGNVFEESHAHAVRNLVINPDLLSAIIPRG